MKAIYDILSFVHIFICFGLCGFILLQKTTGNGLFTSSSSNPFMSGTETSNIITILTKTFALAFILNTITLASIGMRVSRINVASEVIEKKGDPADFRSQIPSL